MHQYDVYLSKITAELLEAITGDTYMRRTQIHIIDYDSRQMINNSGDMLTLTQSKHILGASQICLRTSDGTKIVYSGDISPKDRPPECDILIIDSTRGSPRFDRPVDESLKRRLVEYVRQMTEWGNPVCIHAHRGKLQETMHMLSQCEDIASSVPFLSSPKDCILAKVYGKYGYSTRDLTYLSSYHAQEIIHDDYPWIGFHSNFNLIPQETNGKAKILRVGLVPGNASMHEDDSGIWIATDEHAEFTDILKYVKAANPQVVVTDNIRTKQGEVLADEIQCKLGIAAKAMPEKP